MCHAASERRDRLEQLVGARQQAVAAQLVVRQPLDARRDHKAHAKGRAWRAVVGHERQALFLTREIEKYEMNYEVTKENYVLLLLTQFSTGCEIAALAFFDCLLMAVLALA